ncbi:MAG: hypothetical protein EOM72_04590 [Opitutae bacterium]|nr:hypothetical protein [Opitutae bacterium]
MQLSFYAIPARGDAGLQEDLNRFLRSHRVLTAHREFVANGENSYWALAVEFLEGPAPSGPGPGEGRGGKPRVDYKEVLSPGDFALFARLRDWRKATAEQEGIPVYAVLTNEQLAGIAAKRPESLAGLKEIEGLGDAKAGKYGAAVLAVVALTGTPQPDGVEPVPPEGGNGGPTSASAVPENRAEK